MRVLITGAHHTPAVAVIEELKKEPDIKIIYVGREKTMEGDSIKSIESQAIPAMGVKFIPINTGRLQRSFTVHTIPSLIKIPFGFIQALFIILVEKPDIILSFGGYVSVPVVIAGWLFSKPIIIHEQTLVYGLANRISSYFADKVALSFLPTENLKEKHIVTGNPIRKNVLIETKLENLDPELQEVFKLAKEQKSPVLLVMGGNQGSHIINSYIEKIIGSLVKNVCVIHITGDNSYNDYERLKNLGDFDGKYKVFKWIGKDYGGVLQRIDLVISRAGINSLTEAALAGKPVLVIPIPYLYQDEQNKNASFFSKVGLVEIIPQSKLTKDILLKKIKSMLKNLPEISKNAKKAKGVVILDAAQRLTLEVKLLLNEYNDKKKS